MDRDRVQVLHVVATQQRRGAETFLADLLCAFGSDAATHRVGTLHGQQTPQVSYPVLNAVVAGDRRSAPTFDPRIVASLGRLVRRWRPDLVQAHGGEALKYAVTAFPRVPIVYRRIGAAPPALSRFHRRLTYRLLVRRAARVVAVSEAVRQETIALFGVRADRVVTIPNGVDGLRVRSSVDRCVIRDAIGIPCGVDAIVSLGSLSWEKDPLTHLGLTAPLLRERRELVHVFVGDGPMRSEVEAEVHRQGLAGRVLLLGSRSDVGDLLAASDVLLFASRPDGMEGMPASVIEAGMAGVPVVGFDVAGVSEVVRDGDTGFLIPWGDSEALRQRLALLLDDRSLRRRMGEEGGKVCRSTFDISVIAPQYLQLYEELVRNR